MKKLFYLFLLLPLISFSQQDFIETNDVKATLKKEKITITSDDSKEKRRAILVYMEKDTLYDVTKKGKFIKDIKYKPVDGLQIFELKVITYSKYGSSSLTSFLATITMYFD